MTIFRCLQAGMIFLILGILSGCPESYQSDDESLMSSQQSKPGSGSPLEEKLKGADDFSKLFTIVVALQDTATTASQEVFDFTELQNTGKRLSELVQKAKTPFYTPPAQQESTTDDSGKKDSGFKLQAIWYKPNGKSQAMLNGETVEEGTMLDKTTRVEKIFSTYIIIKQRATSIKVELPK